MSQEPTYMSHHKQKVEDRRAAVARLTAAGASARRIADELGVSKDTVLRDRAANGAPPATDRRALFRAKAGQAADAMEQLRAAVIATQAARPAYQILVDDDTAAQWLTQLRQDAAALAAVADSFRDYYPHLTHPPASVAPCPCQEAP
ncbi:helix-turn-helix domain-containing protein [Streptomyces sp. PCS3-D2]|uniref:helix-turn-helix domain-containing protein n=1 Tax=Streptomyces sp. PCS3-D2 TaxID=1460244 RepID=UPI0004481903|nr:helix-turn-helix domain-containing protein [Streptomyces sp. PCS3-D2]WKV74238.1 helix-turn-helix domain-containing protein [Streptomyces sp. PCS3-D2]